MLDAEPVHESCLLRSVSLILRMIEALMTAQVQGCMECQGSHFHQNTWRQKYTVSVARSRQKHRLAPMHI